MATPRETGEVIGSRGTAATKDVQVSPTDATAGALLNNETTHIGGNLNYTEENYQPFVFGGVVNASTAEGIYRSATEMIILLDIMSAKEPTGVLLSPSAKFGVFNFNGGGFLRTITSADISVAGLSKNKVKLLVTGFTGLVSTDSYEIKVDTITPSTMTVTF